MFCGNRFCIYEENNLCILDSISLNEVGLCEDCIIINLSEDILKEEKKRLLESYEAEYEF